MSTLEGDFYCVGTWTFRSIVLPSSCIGNTQISAGAGIEAEKLETRLVIHHRIDGTIATITVPLHCVNGATGDIIKFRAGLITPCTGNATITVDLEKAGATILTTVATLDSGVAARVMEDALVATATLVADDWLDLVIVATVGTGALGADLLVELIINEDPA